MRVQLVRGEVLQEELGRAAVGLRGQRLAAVVEAHPGAAADALERAAGQRQVEQEHRLRLCRPSLSAGSLAYGPPPRSASAALGSWRVAAGMSPLSAACKVTAGCLGQPHFGARAGGCAPGTRPARPRRRARAALGGEHMAERRALAGVGAEQIAPARGIASVPAACARTCDCPMRSSRAPARPRVRSMSSARFCAAFGIAQQLLELLDLQAVEPARPACRAGHAVRGLSSTHQQVAGFHRCAVGAAAARRRNRRLRAAPAPCSGNQTTAGATVENGSGSTNSSDSARRRPAARGAGARAPARGPAAAARERLARPGSQRLQQHGDDEIERRQQAQQQPLARRATAPARTTAPRGRQATAVRRPAATCVRRRRAAAASARLPSSAAPQALAPPRAAARCRGWAGRTGRTSRGRRRSAAAGCR